MTRLAPAATAAEPLLLRAAIDRRTSPRKLIQQYAWSIPSSAALRTIAWHSPRGVVEIGSGTGYWAFELARAGVTVHAHDVQPRMSLLRGKRSWHPVKMADHRVAANHPGQTLLLVWPTHSGAWADQALRLYQGQTVIYVGPDTGGCCATPAFFVQLTREWERLETVCLPAFGGGRPDDARDRLHVYRRRERPVASQSVRVAGPRLRITLNHRSI